MEVESPVLSGIRREQHLGGGIKWWHQVGWHLEVALRQYHMWLATIKPALAMGAAGEVTATHVRMRACS